jgi:uncharacterized membrane protein (DUF106 family)
MLEQITGALISTFDVLFAPLILLNPVISLFVVSLIITVIILAFNALLINRKMVRNIKDSMEDLREAMTKAQKIGNTNEVSKLMNEIMKLNSKYFKQTYKSLFVSIIVVIIFLPWVGQRYGDMGLELPFVGNAIKSITIPVIGYEITAWILWYVLVSFTIGWVLRKLLGFD